MNPIRTQHVPEALGMLHLDVKLHADAQADAELDALLDGAAS